MFALVNGKKKACFEVIRFEHGKLTDTEFWLIDSVDDLPQARFLIALILSLSLAASSN